MLFFLLLIRAENDWNREGARAEPYLFAVRRISVVLVTLVPDDPLIFLMHFSLHQQQQNNSS